MTRNSLLSRLLPVYLVTVVLSLAAMTWMAARDMNSFYYRQKVDDLTSIARIASSSAQQFFEVGNNISAPTSPQDWCKGFATRSGTRVTMIGQSGAVLCDSERDPAGMDDHSSRPEIRQALAEGDGSSVRYSYTLEKNLLYVAVPLEGTGEGSVVRVAVPVSSLTDALLSARYRLFAGSVAAGLLIVLVTVLLSRRITSPLREIHEGVDRYARGEFSVPIRSTGTKEFVTLATEMNRMAQQLDDRMRTVINQRNELEAVLSSMVEGVLAFDTDERLISLNRAAAFLLGVREEDVVDRPIQEVLRNSTLQRFVSTTLESDSPLEEEAVFYNGQKRYIQAHGTPLNDAAGKRMGALVVLNDVTNIRHLENIRREFVANASHEIRTPITSIKGFVETLMDGALDDPEVTRRFLGIIGKHSDRLNTIVADLLDLSRVETAVESGEMSFEESSIREVVDKAVEACHAGIEEKDIRLKVNCPQELRGNINPPLLVMALINLLENAVKYSKDGGRIIIVCSKTESTLELSVQDEGSGIEAKHLPRLFERFYRVDKARSREVGGTGLGLAIVKHIVQAHNGEVSVTSTPGKGSTFTISLPA
ncbi:MAG: ATP-binding protein [bacterium]|nr:ATP-binding protein [bacterium]